MTPREAFKIGFLLRCADEGLTAEQVTERMTKAAALTQAVEQNRAKQASTVGNLASVLTTLGIALPVAVGVGGGYLAAKGQESPVDANDVKRQELLQEYRRLTRLARRTTQEKSLQLAR